MAKVVNANPALAGQLRLSLEELRQSRSRMLDELRPPASEVRIPVTGSSGHLLQDCCNRIRGGQIKGSPDPCSVPVDNVHLSGVISDRATSVSKEAPDRGQVLDPRCCSNPARAGAKAHQPLLQGLGRVGLRIDAERQQLECVRSLVGEKVLHPLEDRPLDWARRGALGKDEMERCCPALQLCAEAGRSAVRASQRNIRYGTRRIDTAVMIVPRGLRPASPASGHCRRGGCEGAAENPAPREFKVMAHVHHPLESAKALNSPDRRSYSGASLHLPPCSRDRCLCAAICKRYRDRSARGDRRADAANPARSRDRAAVLASAARQVPFRGHDSCRSEPPREADPPDAWRCAPPNRHAR